MHNWHDTYARRVFSQPDATADLVRHLFPKDVVEQLDLASLRLIDEQLGGDQLGPEIETDFLWEARTTVGDSVLVYVLLEHQSTVDRWMALRMLRYRVRLWEAYRTREPDSPLPPILPLVLYHGKKAWNAALDVAKLTTPLDDLTQLRAAYRVLDVSSWRDEEILTMALGGMTQLALLALANSRRGVGLDAKLEAWARLIRSMVGFDQGFEAVVLMLEYWMRVNRLANLARAREIAASFSPKLEEVMQSFAEEMKEEGRQEGLERGMERGLERGLAEGRVQERTAILRRMLERKFGSLPEGASTRLGTATPEDLELWLDRVLTEDSIDGVFRD